MGIFDLSFLGAPFGRLHGRLTRGAPEKLDGVVLGHQDDGKSVIWPYPSPKRAGHLFCGAASGSGKSVLIASALVEQLRAKPDTAALVIDPKSDLVTCVLSAIASTAPDLMANVTYLDPFRPQAAGRASFPLNLCRLPSSSRTPKEVRAIQIAGLVSRASTAMVDVKVGTGARQLDTLTNVIQAALAVPDERASILLALDGLANPDAMKALGQLTTATEAGAFLREGKVNPELLASTASRLRTAFAITADTVSMMSADGCLDWGQLLGPGRICLVDLGRPYGLEPLQALFASLLLTLVADHLLARPSPYTGHHVFCVIDEVQQVSGVLRQFGDSFLSTGRSKNLSFTLMSQGTAIIERAAPGLMEVVNANSNALVGRLAAADAQRFAQTISATPGVNEGVGAIRQRFASKVANLEDRVFISITPGERRRFRSREIDMQAWQRAFAGVDLDALAVRSSVSVRQPRWRLADLIGAHASPSTDDGFTPSPWG